MSEREVKSQPSSDAGSQGASPPESGEAFRRATNLVAVQSTDSEERARRAFSAIEGRETADQQSQPITNSDAVTQGITEDQSEGGNQIDTAAEKEIDEALDEKALEDGVADANDAARIVGDLTPHNF